MNIVSRLLSSISEGRYLSSLHPQNREYIKGICDTLAGCSGQFNVLNTTLDTDAFTTRLDALKGIFTLSTSSHEIYRHDDEAILSPIGVARHIGYALEKPERIH